MNDNTTRMDKRIEILQASFEHYYKMAMDHHTKATTSSNILIVVVGALLVIIGIDNKICQSPEDIGSAILIILIGFIGAIWVWKQYERYLYWEYYSTEYHKELKIIMPEFKTAENYKKDAKCYIKSKGLILHLLSKIKDIFLWVLLHILIMLIGAILLYLSLQNNSCYRL